MELPKNFDNYLGLINLYRRQGYDCLNSNKDLFAATILMSMLN